MVITEYKKKYNQEYFDIVEKVFHKCGLCQLPILLDSDMVASHLHSNKATHNMSHKEYNLKYMVLQQVGKLKSEKKYVTGLAAICSSRYPKDSVVSQIKGASWIYASLRYWVSHHGNTRRPAVQTLTGNTIQPTLVLVRISCLPKRVHH